MKFEDLKAYQAAMEIGEMVYEIAGHWDYFDKKTLGSQVVRSADSIAAHETKTWLHKARSRNLITTEQSCQLLQKMEYCIALLNGLIKSTGSF